MNIKIGILNVPKHGNKHDLIHFVTMSVEVDIHVLDSFYLMIVYFLYKICHLTFYQNFMYVLTNLLLPYFSSMWECWVWSWGYVYETGPLPLCYRTNRSILRRYQCDHWSDRRKRWASGEPRQEKTCLCHMRTTKAQISLCIRTVWSAPLLFAAWIVLYLYLLYSTFQVSVASVLHVPGRKPRRQVFS